MISVMITRMKTVLEIDESVDVDFSVSVSDIESEALDQSDAEQDTLFQSAADDSIKALFNQIDGNAVTTKRGSIRMIPHSSDALTLTVTILGSTNRRDWCRYLQRLKILISVR